MKKVKEFIYKTMGVLICINCIFSTNISAQTVVNSGTTGPLTWVLYSNGTLNISGNGNMPDYSYNYYDSAPWLFHSLNTKTVVLTDGVKSIGNYAFWDLLSLTSVSIPNSVTSIGYSAFSFCSSLTSISIPNSVTSIGSGAFNDCSSLTSISIPNSVTSIGYSAFSSCSSLTSVSIPNSVTSIGYSVFSNCSSLTSVSIPNSVTSIENSTFWNCRSLTSVSIPNSVTSIGNYAFYNCSSLASISIPNSVTSIGYSAFNGCSGLTSVTVGWNMPLTINPNVFSGLNPSNIILSNIILNVPAGTKSAYQANEVWGKFNIVEACIPNLTVQVWDDVLSVINEPTNNGGHTFVAYQWQKNGEDLAGETSGNLYLAQLSDADYQAQYSVRLTDNGGNTWQTCPVQLHRLSGKVSVYPNPAAQTLTIESKDVKAGDIIGIYNLAGKLVRQYPAEKQQTQLDISSLHKGVYIVKIKDKQIRVSTNR